MSEKIKFGSCIGLIAATVGSAVGLGNVWRFPAEAQANGGAAFLLVYILCVLVLGIPVMAGEFALGRGGESDAIGVFKKLAPTRKWWIVGVLAILASYLILSFYMVVSGWTFEYMIQSIDGNLYSGDNFGSRMSEYIASPVKPVIFTLVMLAVNLVILMKGVQKGIERVSNMLMPMLFLVLLILGVVALSLPGAGEGLKYFFSPDFSKITPKVVLNALGQAFFSLSLGMGILITYSSYFPANTKLPRTAFTVSMLDLLVAVMMGMIIFPSVSAFGLADHTLEGTTLVFVTLPEVFAHMPLSQMWSTLFFLLLTTAALTSTISLAEVAVAMMEDRFGMSRKKACIVVVAPLCVISTLCSLSLTGISWLTIFDLSLFDFLDAGATNILLPMVALFTCVFVGWYAPKGMLRNQLTNNGQCNRRLYPWLKAILRYVAPVLIAIILVSYFL